MDYQIEYSVEEMKDTLEQNLDEIHAVRFNERYAKALGDSFTSALAEWEKDIRRCQKSPFTIAVVGDFKRGKSTLINALLGQEVVTTDVTTETVTTNRITYGIHTNEAILSGGRIVRLTDADLHRDRLETIIGEIGEHISRMELKRDIDLLKDIAIVDTPGTGDAMRDFSEEVKDALLWADAVIYVFNVQYPLSRTEQLFLKSAVLPQKHTKLFLVGNFSDILHDSESYHRISEMLEKRIKSMLPDAKPYLVSALDELCQRLGEERASGPLSDELDANFRTLRDDIQKLVEARAESVVLDRMQRLSKAMCLDMLERLASMEKGLSMEKNEYDQMLLNAKQEETDLTQKITSMLLELDNTISNMKTEAYAWMGQFLSRIVQESNNLHEASEDDLKRYYENYCIDLIQEAINSCVEYHQDQLLAILDNVAEGGIPAVGNGLDVQTNYRFRISLDNRIWTKGDTVGLVSSCVSSFNVLTLVGSIVADSVAGAMRNKEKKKRLPELLEKISENLPLLSADVTETVNSIYTELGEKAKQLLADYYRQRMAREQELLNQTIQCARKTADEKETLIAVITEVRTIFSKF